MLLSLLEFYFVVTFLGLLITFHMQVKDDLTQTVKLQIKYESSHQDISKSLTPCWYQIYQTQGTKSSSKKYMNFAKFGWETRDYVISIMYSKYSLFLIFKLIVPGVPGILTFIDKNIEPLIF